jgi:uncharacterized protein YoxC
MVEAKVEHIEEKEFYPNKQPAATQVKVEKVIPPKEKTNQQKTELIYREEKIFPSELETEESFLKDAYIRATEEHLVRPADPYLHREDIEQGLEKVEKKAEDLYEQTIESIDNAVEAIEKKTEEFYEKTKESLSETKERLNRDFNRARERSMETWEKTYDHTRDTVEHMGQRARAAAEDAKKSAEEAYDWTKDHAKQISGKVEDIYHKDTSKLHEKIQREKIPDAYDRASSDSFSYGTRDTNLQKEKIAEGDVYPWHHRMEVSIGNATKDIVNKEMHRWEKEYEDQFKNRNAYATQLKEEEHLVKQERTRVEQVKIAHTTGIPGDMFSDRGFLQDAYDAATNCHHPFF